MQNVKWIWLMVHVARFVCSGNVRVSSSCEVFVDLWQVESCYQSWILGWEKCSLTTGSWTVKLHKNQVTKHFCFISFLFACIWNISLVENCFRWFNRQNVEDLSRGKGDSESFMENHVIVVAIDRWFFWTEMCCLSGTFFYILWKVQIRCLIDH